MGPTGKKILEIWKYKGGLSEIAFVLTIESTMFSRFGSVQFSFGLSDIGGAMKRLCATVVGLLLATGTHAQTSPVSTPQAALPLLQVSYLLGDQYLGFRQSCLLVYGDGTYHRESHRQRHDQGHARADWQPPEVFEGTISSGELHQLREIIESADFRAITGTIGDPRPVRSHVAFIISPTVGFTPHTDMEILEVTVAHSTGQQEFEVIDSANRKLAGSLKPFWKWYAPLAKSKQGQLDAANATSCTLSSALPHPSTWQPSTYVLPRPFFTPAAAYPIEEQNAKHVGTVILHVTINSDGDVGTAEVKRGINGSLDQYALEAVRKWKFVPARVVGFAIPTSAFVEVHFPPKSEAENHSSSE